MTQPTLAAIRGARIAHLIETDLPGGAERMLASLAGALSAGGCPGVAFLPRGGQGWLTRELQGVGVPVEYFGVERHFSPRLARDLAGAFRRQRIDLVHSHEFTMSFYGAWAARKAGVPHVFTMHGSRYYAGKLSRRIAMRLAVAGSASAVAVSRQLADHLCEDLHLRRDRVVVVMNGVAPPPVLVPTLREELGLAPTDRLLLAVGSLYPVKGHRFLVDALSLLGARYPTAHVAIAGRGEMAEALAAQARELGVDARVHLLGLRSDVSRLLGAADVFVLPSLSEGVPLALLEAMFAARPIVATDVGDVRSVLGEAAGIVVPSGDATALAEAIDRCLADPNAARMLGQHAAARAAAEFGLDRMLDRYAAIYSAHLHRPPADDGSAGVPPISAQ